MKNWNGPRVECLVHVVLRSGREEERWETERKGALAADFVSVSFSESFHYSAGLWTPASVDCQHNRYQSETFSVDFALLVMTSEQTDLPWTTRDSGKDPCTRLLFRYSSLSLSSYPSLPFFLSPSLFFSLSLLPAPHSPMYLPRVRSSPTCPTDTLRALVDARPTYRLDDRLE